MVIPLSYSSEQVRLGNFVSAAVTDRVKKEEAINSFWCRSYWFIIVILLVAREVKIYGV